VASPTTGTSTDTASSGTAADPADATAGTTTGDVGTSAEAAAGAGVTPTPSDTESTTQPVPADTAETADETAADPTMDEVSDETAMEEPADTGDGSTVTDPVEEEPTDDTSPGDTTDESEPDVTDPEVTHPDPVDAQPTTCNLEGAATEATPTVYLIGDSTASTYDADVYPRTGWGQVLQNFFTTACATIDNRARSGRSSKSFYDEGLWAPVSSALAVGDILLIQFGHNDEKTDDAARGTDPFTTFQDYLSIYLDETLAKGATPILLTPINRNKWSGTVVNDTHGDYSVSIRELAASRGVALVDMTQLTKDYFEKLGPDATSDLFMNLDPGQYPNYPDGNSDDTHLREAGAQIVAEMFVADAYGQGIAPGTLAKTAPVAQ
jgi:lysophospholipase L1-like esterase